MKENKMPINSINVKQVKEYIKKVETDIDSFYNKTFGEPTWRDFHDMENDESIPKKIRKFATSLEFPPTEGNAQQFVDYYTKALEEIKKAGLDESKIIFSIDENYMTVGMPVSHINNMSNQTYYNQTVSHKGELISFQKQNNKDMEKAKKIHEDYQKDLDEDTKKKLDKIYFDKIKPLTEINELLEDAILKVIQEEIKYKPAKKLKR